MLTWAFQHTEVSSSQTKVWIGHNSEQVRVVDPSGGTLRHTSAVVSKVITSLELGRRGEGRREGGGGRGRGREGEGGGGCFVKY